MNAVDRNLLLRLARRLEEQAEEAAKHLPPQADPKVYETAKRRRDRELGDARDLREFVKRADAEQEAKVP